MKQFISASCLKAKNQGGLLLVPTREEKSLQATQLLSFIPGQFVRIYQVIQSQKGSRMLRVSRNALHKLAHPEARYQPPASQKESASASKLSCSLGSKQLLKSKSLKLMSFMVRISLIRVFSRVTTCLALDKVAPSGCFLSSSKFKQWLSFLFYSVLNRHMPPPKPVHYFFLAEGHRSATSLCFCNCRCSKERHHTSLCQQLARAGNELWS